MQAPGEAVSSSPRLVSVVMPTHNAERWVLDTIDNLIAQTWPHIELIVVDDCSRDDTVAVVRRKLTADFNHPWQIIAFPDNRGPSAARNAGVKAAAGDWVQFLDSDDFMTPDKLALQMAYCLQAPADVAAVYSPWGRCYFEEGRIVPDGPVMRPTMAGRNPIMALVGHDRPWSGAGLTRRSALDQVGGFDESLRVWENEELIARLAKAGRMEPVASDGPIYFWRLHHEREDAGNPDVRNENRATAMVWIEQMVRVADHRTMDEMNLSAADRADIANAVTEWARGLYGNNLQAFRNFLALARQLDPHIAPTYPAYAATLSRYLGYEGAEAVSRLARIPVALGRKLVRGGPRP